MSTELSRRDLETALRRPPPPLPRRSPRWRAWGKRLERSWRSGELSRRWLLAAPLGAVGFAIWAFGGVYGWAYGTAYGLVFGALAAWCAQALRGRATAEWRPIYLPVILFGLVALAQYGAGLTLVKASTLTAALHLGAAGAVFLLVSQTYRGERDAGWIATAFAALTGALALLAILQALTAANGIYWHFTYAYASPAGSFVNRNHFSGCMEMLLPAACLNAYRRRRLGWLYYLPWAAPPALGVAAILVVGSRGGAVALAVEALAALGLWLYLRRRRGGATALPARRLKPGAPLLIAGGLTLALVAVVGTSRLQARLANTDLNGPSLEQRTELNASSLAMFRQRPWLGWGLGTWADAYPAFARFPGSSSVEFAHNDYLQLLAETGLAGAGCALLFWGIWGWEFGRRVRSKDEDSGPLAVAAAIACLGLLVHSWVDFNLHIPANLLLFFTLAALAISSPKRTASS